MEGFSGEQNMIDMAGMNGMDSLLQQLLANLSQGQPIVPMDNASSEEAKTFSSSSDSHSPANSISPSGEVPMEGADEETVLDSLTKKMRAASPPPSTIRDSYNECFSTTSKDQYEALIYSLFVTHRNAKDGYENFECLSRTNHKCRYKVRAKQTDGVYIVEERGCHSHPFDASGFNSQGLPRTIREIVDVSFNEGWSNQKRQEAVDSEVTRLGLPPNPKMNRQIDNRLSYLRRTRNLATANALLTPLQPGDAAPMHPLVNPVQGDQQMPVFPHMDMNVLAQLLASQQDAFTQSQESQ